jgi:hypothetical protein
VFFFAAINFTLHPQLGFAYIPSYVQAIIPPALFLHIFSVYEVVLTVWLLSGKWNRYCGLLTAATLFGFTVLNLNAFGTLFRNVSIFFSAIAYSFLKVEK